MSFWLTQRISGIILIVYLTVHFWILHYSGNHELNFQVIADRLHNPFWKIFDLTFLPIVLYHSLYGIYSILLDFTIFLKNSKLLSLILTIIGIVAFIIGAKSILAFRI
jgi:succinate dehydrogenase / fumarate reductase membrane anchor subunit